MDGVKEAVVTVAVNGTTENSVWVDQLTCEGVADGLRASVTDSLLIDLWGMEEEVLAVKPEQVLVRVDASGITEAGTYTLPAIVTLQNVSGVTVRGEYEVTVIVAERPNANPQPEGTGSETTTPEENTPETLPAE